MQHVLYEITKMQKFSTRSQKVFLRDHKNAKPILCCNYEMKKVYSASSNVWSYDDHQTQLNFEGTQRADDDVDDCFVDNV